MEKSLRQLLIGKKNEDFNKALLAGKVQMMRLKNIPITIEGQELPNLNLFDLFLDHQNDALFEDYVREHDPKRAERLIKAKYVVVFMADNQYSRFAGVYEIHGEDKRIQVSSEDKKSLEEKVFVKVSYVDTFEDTKGRVLVDWGGKKAQQWLQWFKDKNVIKYDEGIVRIPIPFVSYSDVLLSFKELKNIIDTVNVTWSEKLKAVKGVYCIADRKKGKLYVGSASGSEGIWERWKGYVETNGHGGNDLLKEVVQKDSKYAWKYFQWFILETFPMTMSKDDVLKKEQMYKVKLCTTINGYNKK